MSSFDGNDTTLFDLRLRRGLKAWLDRKNPPAEARARLLEAASQERLPQMSWFAYLLTFAWRCDDAAVSFDRFAKATAYSLQMGIVML